MGFERIGRTFTLKFEDKLYEGLEVKMRGLSTDQFLHVAGMADEVSKKSLSEITPVVRDLFGRAADHMLSWNLEDDGVPVPISRESLLEQDFDFVISIVNAWLEAMAGVSPPLPKNSNGTGTLQEASLPMTLPSRSS